MKAWITRPEGLETTLADAELLLLQTLAGQMRDVFSVAAEHGIRREDPALARLFPDAYQNPADADEFRRLTIDDAATAKQLHHVVMLHDLEAVSTTIEGHVLTIANSNIDQWLSALTDMRLMVFARRAQAEETDPETAEQVTGIYDWLGFVQGSMLEALTTRSN